MKTKPTLGPRRFPRTVEGIERIVCDQAKAAGLPRSLDELQQLVDARVELALSQFVGGLKENLRKEATDHPIIVPTLDLTQTKLGAT